MKLRNYGENPSKEQEDSAWRSRFALEQRFHLQSDRADDPKMEAQVQAIDFSFINRYLAKEVARSGSEVEGDEPLGRDQVILVKKNITDNVDQFEEFKAKKIGHERQPLTRLITICPDDIRLQAKKMEVNEKAWLLFTIFHEAVHDYSFTKIAGAKEFYEANDLVNKMKEIIMFWQARQKKRMTMLSGYKKVETINHGLNRADPVNTPMVEKEVWYDSFDEGVTDKIAYEMALAYLKEHPDYLPIEELELMFKNFSQPGQLLDHGPLIEQVDDFVSAVAGSSGFDREFVWQAVKRGKFSLENIHDQQTRKLLESELPPEIFSNTFPDKRI